MLYSISALIATLIVATLQAPDGKGIFVIASYSQMQSAWHAWSATNKFATTVDWKIHLATPQHKAKGIA